MREILQLKRIYYVHRSVYGRRSNDIGPRQTGLSSVTRESVRVGVCSLPRPLCWTRVVWRVGAIDVTFLLIFWASLHRWASRNALRKEAKQEFH